MTNQPGGWLHDHEDNPWLKATETRAPVFSVPRDLPDSLGIAKWMNIENQGGVGSCAGHARTSVLEACIYHQTRGTVVQLCRMFSYITAQQIDGITGDRGSTITGNAKAAAKWGTCREEFWPYSGRYDRNIPQEAWDHAGEFKLETWSVLKTYSQVFAWLANGIGGVQIGIAWNSSCDKPVIETYRGGGGGGHSVCFLDWTPRLDSQGRRYLQLFNSWGTRWGKNGIAEVSPTAVEQMLADPYTVFVGMSDMADLAPRPVDWAKDGGVYNL